MNKIGLLDHVSHVAAAPNAKLSQMQGSKGGNFGEIFKGTINSVNRLEKEADKTALDLLAGKADIHESMIALQKADISMRLFLKMRNKVMEAYREIMRMQF